MSGTLTETAVGRILILGLGNVLLTDDGIGVHVLRILQAEGTGRDVTLRDGGTMGFALLPDIQEASALIAVDAVRFDAAPGSVRAFVGSDMDRQLWGRKRTAHEVALADLVAAADLSGCLPPRRALVGIEPASLEWGLEPTSAVLEAIPAACRAVRSLVAEWNDG